MAAVLQRVLTIVRDLVGTVGRIAAGWRQRATALLERAQAGSRRAVDRTDAFQQRHGSLSFPYAVIRKMSSDGGGSLAGLIAYYGFLSVFPLLLVFAALLGFVLAGDAGLRESVLTTAESSFPAMQSFFTQTTKGNGLALGAGLVIALWAGLGVTLATERAMNAIWDIPLAERPSLWRSRLRGLAMLCILGATFLVSTALAGLRGISGALAVPAVLGGLLLNVALYLLAFQVLTNRHLAWREILPGALVGAVGWTTLQNLGELYVRHEVAHASQLYGSLAAVVGLLAWIYLGAQLTLYAAEVNVVLTYRLWPRSLTGKAGTDADRRAIIRQIREAGRTTGEVITVSFGDTGADPDTLPPDLARHVAVARLARHLEEFERSRQRVGDCADAASRGELLAHLRAEAGKAADVVDDLARREPELAAALNRRLC